MVGGFGVEDRFAALVLAVVVFFALEGFALEDFALEVFAVVAFDVVAFFAAVFAGALFAAVPLAPGPPRAALPLPLDVPPRRVAEETLSAIFGAFSAIALPICGARFATWSPAHLTALPTVADVFAATFLATCGAFERSVFAIPGALSATALPTAGAFFAISPTRSPNMSEPFFCAMEAAYAMTAAPDDG